MASASQVVGTWILVLLYVSAILYFVIRGALKTKSLSDYAIGTMNFSPVSVGLSLAASMTSAATFVINPGFIANYGISGFISFGIIFPIGSIASLIILTKSFQKYGQTIKALTLAQWIGQRYKSKGYALLMAFLSLLLITFIVLIIVAITKVLSKALNVDEILILVSLIVFVFGYMMFGGANSMVYTNTIQAAIMIVVAVILLTSGYQHFSDGIASLFDKLRNIDPNLVTATNAESPLFRDFFEIIFCQLVVGIAVVCQPHIITKSLLLKSEKDVNKFLTVSVIVEILFFLVVFAGIYARLTFPDLSVDGTPLKNDGIIPAYVIKTFAGGFAAVAVGLLVVLGLISAGMSTLEGLIQSVSTTITSDIIKPLFGDKIKSEKGLINGNRLTIAAIAVIAGFISYDQILNPKLSVGLLAQNGVYAFFSAAFIPILFGIFIKDVKIIAPLTATITAIATHFSVYYFLPFLVAEFGIEFGFFTKYLEGTVRNPAIASASAIVLSTVVGLVIHYLTKNKVQN
ncbi:MAG: sodium:solute symporter [Ignavibacteriae bacterium]|nr:sodium:solute symporter [Ignavibacteriota bacterium]NOG97818.1 sodium:solute symporter [Ignavibacteriota bacterium]